MNAKQNIKISVITPAYNADRFIRETIDSVLQQTYPHWEMIIVDDCSSDNTAAIVREYEQLDERVRFIQLEKNGGSAVARNTAMENATGRYLAFLDSDDLWQPEKLEKQLQFMQDKNIVFSYTKYVRILENGTRTPNVSKAPPTITYGQLMKKCVIGCLTVMLDRDKIGHLKMPNIRTRQDYAFWLKILRKGYVAYGLPEVLAEYRLVKDSISSNKIKAAKQNWYVYRHVEQQNIVKSLWYFSNYAIKSVLDLLKFKLSK